MDFTARELFETDSSQTLKLAYQALDNGEAQRARELAQSVLIAAKASANLHHEARALSCLAHCDRVASRLRRASDASRRAAQLFERLNEVEGEAAALTTLAHVSMLLGRNDEAVEAALLCVRLCDIDAPRPPAVFASNCLGIAYCWSGSFERADEVLEQAIDIAGRCTPPVSDYPSRLNQAWVEAARLVDERYRTGTMQSLDKMAERVEAFSNVEKVGDDAASGFSAMPLGDTVSIALAALAACWQGRLDSARAQSRLAVRSLSGTVTWLDALVHWVIAELAWARSDWATAEKALSAMKDEAVSVEHEQMVCIGHLLLAQVYEVQGRNDEARREHRQLRLRERRLASESLASREALVDWQLGARKSERHLQQALVASRQFERWSLEDALTGIANRRRFERDLTERLRNQTPGGAPVSVAMIDVNQFKAINDTYTHQVGDRVLKTLAAVLTASVRSNDTPARLAGDEFVILFDDASAHVAQDVCERVSRAVDGFDWPSIAPELRVSISIGFGEAIEGDTVESLLQRSDRSMYAVKPGWSPTSFE